MANVKESKTCAVCGKTFSLRDLVPGMAVRDVIANEILREHRRIVVVTHGVFRPLLGLELVARGWTAERRVSGYQHWSGWPYRW